MKMTDRERLIQYAKIIRNSADKILDIVENSTESFDKQQISIVEETAKIMKFVPDWDDWPDAVPGFLITAPTSTGIAKRARAVLNMCDLTDLSGKRFLDFGCGDGSIVKEAKIRRASVAHGYDPSEEWAPLRNMEDTFFTSDYNKLSSDYDTILLYDVLDHSQSPVEVIRQVRKLIDVNGEVKVRCHPFTSKHANHVYKTFNKAYTHFFLTPEDLKEHKPLPVFKMTGVVPTEQYKKWFNENGFEIRKETIDRQSPDGDCLKNIPRQEIKSIINHEDYKNIMEMQFIDYTIFPVQ